ncbi:hypothetical protein [Clostridium cellulovorans]|uniref:Uncharacterized protein n=1 Tax=Clostridium cellulovorans (strain ATCC 35296 / DSM 3052 / OCM 3 / 743B) TaxID=573061 RepID=D9SVQ1_CLOC7|nr:hypothetical protein [Clostridium cellulovorans]ADL53112.1 hypothetical protein Clocel_3434 [Clostridium cellulovorans 743B]
MKEKNLPFYVLAMCLGAGIMVIGFALKTARASSIFLNFSAVLGLLVVILNLFFLIKHVAKNIEKNK